MSTIETKFGIGDEVCKKSDLRRWATGVNSDIVYGRVEGIAIKETEDRSLRVLYKAKGLSQEFEDDLVLVSAAKPYVIGWLAGRLDVVVNTEI